MTTPHRWIVELTGHRFDLEDLPELLAGSPLAVETQGTGWILSPDLFAGMTDVTAVRELAQTRIRLLDGLHRCASHEARPITMGVIRSVDEQGTTNVYMYAHEKISVRSKARLSVIRNGVEVPDDNTGRLSPLAQLAFNDPLAGKALRLMAERPTTWHNLYKIYEIVLAGAGGARGVTERGWATLAEIEHFKATANHPDASGDAARHGVQKGRYEKTPMEIGTAFALVRRLANRWLESQIAAMDLTRQTPGDDTPGV